MKSMKNLEIIKNKRILLTGHTGFKGSWMCEVLMELGADVIGYSLEPPTSPSLFQMLELDKKVNSHIGDIRDIEHLRKVFEDTKPEIVIHMAAQPLVRESYINPVYTYETNVMGTVNLLECCRNNDTVKSIVNVTTDKVYRNNEWDKGYIETDYLDGYDPYSNSKSCSELVTHSYVQSFFEEKGIPVSTCRAGNVIGGGDFSKDRIIPDCYRAASKGEDIVVRNPYSTRPYQHVLEPLFAYLMVVTEQYKDPNFASSYNVGPDDESCVNTGKLVDLFVERWNKNSIGKEPKKIGWVNRSDGGPHEANFLKLDCTKLKKTFGWKPVWNIEKTMDKTVEWYKSLAEGENVGECVSRQIRDYIKAFCD
ncbi:MAG: CDP-glucose 4,6-dehydratase [Lachnospiraceae bacterium]|nr:CDP-glucose 4,6-dehydratase [Lachnospiraceae bacterium]